MIKLALVSVDDAAITARGRLSDQCDPQLLCAFVGERDESSPTERRLGQPCALEPRQSD
jgi:hypothetical protein